MMTTTEIKELRARVAELEAEISRSDEVARLAAEWFEEIEDENTELTARVALLEATLLPFANAYANVKRREGWYVDVTMPTKYLRAAAEAMEP